jgi:hypothetical protein
MKEPKSEAANQDGSSALASAHGSASATNMLNIKDRAGVITVAEMRRYFERMVTDTSHFQGRTPLGIMEINGQFSHYMDANTDTLWIGFALGMRCAERFGTVTPNDKAHRPGQ